MHSPFSFHDQDAVIALELNRWVAHVAQTAVDIAVEFFTHEGQVSGLRLQAAMLQRLFGGPGLISQESLNEGGGLLDGIADAGVPSPASSWAC